MANPFGDGEMKAWHHLDCIFDSFLRARATTKIIEVPADDIDGFHNLKPEDQSAIEKKIEGEMFFGLAFSLRMYVMY